MSVRVRSAVAADAGAWEAMRAALWPDAAEGEHRQEIDDYFAGRFPRWPWGALVAVDEDGAVCGFAEVSVRPCAEGCESPRVAYLEAWFVEDGHRRRGVGRALVAAAAEWGRAQGCSEFGSDADPDNEASVAAHRALGFRDAGLVRCFHMRLD